MLLSRYTFRTAPQTCSLFGIVFLFRGNAVTLKSAINSLLLFAILALAIPGVGQTPAQPPPVGGNLSPSSPEEDDARARLTRDMAKKANEERHVALKYDTDKLLRLAVDLKAYVDKSNEHILSVDVVKKAEEIEKLAHSVKDKMKGPN
jgi:hypothetical protein